MSEKKEKDSAQPHHTGSTGAEDDELSRWLIKQWTNGESPERIELFQTSGRNKSDRGEMIFHQSFKPAEKLDPEQANKLANEIMEAAQNDCDATRKDQLYQLAVIDRNRRAQPVVRRVGPIQPKRNYALKVAGSVGIDEDDDETINIQTLDLRRIKEANEQVRWREQRNDRVVEGMLLLQDNIIKNQQQALDRFFEKGMVFFEKLQDSMDRGAQRDLMVEKERFNMKFKQEMMRVGMNALPGIFNAARGMAPAEPAPAITEVHSSSAPQPTDFGESPERTLVENFMQACEEDKIDIALFGEAEEVDGVLKWTKQGIFTPTQLRTLTGVRIGRLPVSALDNLIPDSGHKDAITSEQLDKARAAGVTDGMGYGLIQIVGLRRSAKEAAQTTGNEK